MEHTIEGELMPMGRELGLGVTPWSPLRGGVLSGKYTRANAGHVPVRFTTRPTPLSYSIGDNVRISRSAPMTSR
jgi:aryl-alcohol dehydrogenase-like predicted oxidoreductase